MAGVVKTGVSRLASSAKSLFTMTDAAKSRVRELMKSRKSPCAGIRIGVKKGGCNGYVYTMHFAEAINKTDEVVKQEDITLIVDPKATLAIIGTEMDFVKDKLKSEFVFTNPNAKGTCGCGESFNL
jgi:iron-sulfur cluster assembly protein